MNEKIIFPEISYCDLLHHAPPYDSPLEEQFAYHFDKYRNRDATLFQQVQVNTICGSYWLDFAAKIGTSVVGIECDGKEFHDANRDLWRDSMILATGTVDRIYRFRGQDLNYHINDCLFLLSEVEPQVFSERGIINLSQLSSSEARDAEYKSKYVSESAMLLFRRNIEEETNRSVDTSIHIERRSKDSIRGKRPEWQYYFQYAKQHGSGNLKKIIKAHDESNSI